MNDVTEENLTLSFQIKNCEKDYYYKICVNSKEEEIDDFETDKILCTKGGDDILFEKKMNCIFLFEKKQQISIITRKEKFYSNNENIKGIKRDKFLASLAMLKGGIYERNINDSYNSEILSVKLEKEKSEEEKKYLFDYLKTGTKFSCFISLDFSRNVTKDIIKSNKNILKHIFQSLEIYTRDEFFYPIGFGAKIKNTNIPVFDMSKSNVSSDILLEQYKVFLESTNIVPEKKIQVSHLIKKIIDGIYKLFDSKIYNVAFILLSDDIDIKDKKKAIDNIITSSYLPLSIIAIGLRDEDYKVSKEIFENKSKYSSQGMEKNRNNVIFTTLNNHSSSNEAILFCLRKLYKQAMKYYELIKYNPENDEKENENNLKMSLSVIQSVIDNNYNKDCGAAPTSTNPYVKMNSMPLEQNKLNLGSSNLSYDINQQQSININNNENNKYNINNINSINSINSQNYNNNINISNNSDSLYSLKDSSKSCPTYETPFHSNKNKKVIPIKGIENDSGGTPFNSTKGSDLKNSDEK